jgi:S-adenosylmethionine-diacylglycerol 3-amino-3-carboxypropyl transferase
MNSASYWDGHMKKIEKGIIHSGRYEGYMRLLKKAILTPLIRNGVIEKLFETEDTAARTELFSKKWKNFRWWLLTRILLSRRMNTLFFDKAFFTYLEKKHSLGNHFAQKAERAITELPMKKNYFLSYILLGKYYSNEYLPPYLRRENFETIRSRLDRIVIVTDSCEHFFSTLPDSTISKLNFTNIFEWMSAEAYENLLRETIRVAKNGAIMTYRNLLVFREHPASLEENIRSLRQLAKSLHKQDLSFIYNNYIVEEIHKGEGK